MREKKSQKKGKKILFLVSGIFLALSLISFIGNLVLEKETDIKAEQKQQADERAKGDGPGEQNGVDSDSNISYTGDKVKPNDANWNGTALDVSCAVYLGVKTDHSLNIQIDGEDTYIELDAVEAPSSVYALDATWRERAQQQISEILTEGQPIYLYVTGNTHGYYTGFVYDDIYVDTKSFADFEAHCVNARLIKDGLCGVHYDNYHDIYKWCNNLLYNAENAQVGLWEDVNNFALYQYAIPRELQEKLDAQQRENDALEIKDDMPATETKE